MEATSTADLLTAEKMSSLEDQEAAKQMALEKALQGYEGKFDQNADEIVPGLFLGSQLAALDLEGLKKHDIKHVLCPAIVYVTQKPHLGKVNYLVWDCLDSGKFPIIWCFPEYTSYMDDALSKGENVLVHCQAGVSRSSAVVCAYLLTKGFGKDESNPAKACYQMIREKRSKINEGRFVDQLELWHALDYTLPRPEDFQKFFAKAYDRKGNKLARMADGNAALEQLRDIFSIAANKKMREAYLGNARTFWPIQEDLEE